MIKFLKSISTAVIMAFIFVFLCVPVWAQEETVILQDSEQLISEEESLMSFEQSEDNADIESATLEADSRILATDVCGTNAVYELIEYADGSHELHISGTGAIENAPDWKALFQEQGVSSATLNIEEGITEIGASAFAGCNFLKGALILPESLTKIGYRAFYSCFGLTGRLDLPDSVSEIGGYAFYGCTGFYGDLSFSSGMQTICDYAFNGCLFTSYYLPAQITYLGDKLTFPKMVNGKDVTILALKNSYAYTWAKDHAYTVQAAEAKYTIEYNPTGGTVEPKNKIVYENRPFGELAIPVRAGYEFVGWYDAAVDGAKVSANTICTGDLMIYAYWNPLDYKVSFDKTGGSGTANDKDVVFDSPYGILPVVTRDHYTFVGWFTEEVGGTEITPVTPVVIPSNHTLYAHWTGDSITVNFDKVGGVGSATAITAEYGAPYGSLPVLTKDNCEFMGWYTTLSGGTKVEADTIVTFTLEHTLYARWKGKEVTVSFDRTGGTGSTPDMVVSYGAVYGTLPSTARFDKDFGGWYTQSSGGTRIESTSVVTETSDHTLYAHWTAKHVEVDFDMTGGSGTAEPINVIDGDPYGTLPTCTRDGYDFAGWYTQAGGGSVVTSATTVSNVYNHTLYAHWTPKQYTVSFDLCGGSGSAPDRTVTFGDGYGELPTVGRTHYEFGGWYTSSTGGVRVSASTRVDTASNHTLYAHWIGSRVNVSFDPVGGYGDLKDIRVNYDAAYGELPVASKYGFRQTGWYTQAEGGSQVTPDTIVSVAVDHTLYAHWTAQDYNVTYHLNGGSNDLRNPATYQRSNYSIKLYDGVKNGYTFGGWYTTSNFKSGTLVRQIPRNLAQNMDLYAKWILNTYKITYYTNLTGASNPNASKAKYSTVEPDYILKPASKKGYVHLGWYLDPEFTQPVFKISCGDYGDLRLFSKWRGAEYKVYYHGNGALGGFVPPSTHEYMKPGTALADGTEFILPGYHVKAWYTDPEFKGTKYALGYAKNNICTEDGSSIDLYACWEANTYYVMYNPNGTKGRTAKSTFVYDRNFKIGKCSYTRTGYVFDSWNTEEDGSGTKYMPGQVVADMTDGNKEIVNLYAQWTPITYYIAFNGNKASSGTAMEPVSVKYDETVTLPANTYVRDGYTFAGWSGTVKIGKSYPSFDDCDPSVLNLMAKQNGTYVLKANWEYEYTLDPNGAPESAITVGHNAADVLVKLQPNTFVYPGHRFQGWADTPGGKVRYGNKSQVKNIAGKTLYAVWK